MTPPVRREDAWRHFEVSYRSNMPDASSEEVEVAFERWWATGQAVPGGPFVVGLDLAQREDVPLTLERYGAITVAMALVFSFVAIVAFAAAVGAIVLAVAIGDDPLLVPLVLVAGPGFAVAVMAVLMSRRWWRVDASLKAWAATAAERELAVAEREAAETERQRAAQAVVTWDPRFAHRLGHCGECGGSLVVTEPDGGLSCACGKTRIPAEFLKRDRPSRS